MTDMEILGAAIAYTNKCIAGAGGLKGANCTIKSIDPIAGGNRITFEWEDNEGHTETSTMDVMDGADGQDGVSPTISVSTVTGGHAVSITDAQGTNTFNVMDGIDGTNGTNGTDGVGITSITFKGTDSSGNNVYTVNLSNSTSYDITCPKGPAGATGSTGPVGPGVASGGTAGQVLKKKSGTDYDTEWVDESSSVVANPEGQTTETLTALEVDGTKYAVGGGGGTSERPIDFDSVVGGGRSTESILYNTFTCSFDDTYNDWSINILALTGSINLTNVDKIKLSCVSATFSGEALVRVYLTEVNTYSRGYGVWSNLLSDNNLHAQLEITENGDYEINTSGITGNRYIYVVALTGLNQGQQGRCDDNKLGAFDGTLSLYMYADMSGGGHTIVNDAGTSMTQRDALQFKGGLAVSDDSVNERTVVSDDYELITWANWQTIVANHEEELHPNAIITGAPGADGDISVDLMTKLWENPSPTSSFAAQDITLSNSEYDMLMTIAIGNANNENVSCISTKGYDVRLSRAVAGGSGCVNDIRLLSYVSDTKLHAEVGQRGVGTSNVLTDNRACVPLVIYGIKTTASAKISVIAESVSTSADKCMLDDGVTSVEDALEYSTTEHKVGKWIDGSDLYEKTVDFGTLPNNTSRSVSSGLSNVTIRKMWGIAEESGDFIPLPYPGMSNNLIRVYYDKSNNNVVVGSTYNTSGYTSSYVTLQYTKNS